MEANRFRPAAFPHIPRERGVHADMPSGAIMTDTPITTIARGATLNVWEKPSGDLLPTKMAVDLRLNDIIGPKETVLIVSFGDVVSAMSRQICKALDSAGKLGLSTMVMVGINRKEFLGALLHFSAGKCNKHNRKGHMGEEVIFAPNKKLLKALGIERPGTIKSRNSLILINNGDLVARWIDDCRHGVVSVDNLPTPHDWHKVLEAYANIRGVA